MLVVVALALGLLGCTSSRSTGRDGWSVLARPGALPQHRRYATRFDALTIEPKLECSRLHEAADAEPDAPVLVVVHGLGGAGPEWDDALSMLQRSHPAATYVYRWESLERREEILRRLTLGLDSLAGCLHRRIIVLAHSAGGILSSLAASKVELPADVQLEVVTVASPLAGTMARPEEKSPFFLFDLGSRLAPYQPASDNVKVVHLRTSWPADRWMKPGRDGVKPSAASVPGATVVDLPDELSHVGALLWVANRISRDGWDHWLDGLLSGG